MSLINDALKRAKQAQRDNPAPAPTLPFRAAEPAEHRSSDSPMLMIAGILAIVALGGLLAVLALRRPAVAQPVVNARQLSDPTQVGSPALETAVADPIPPEPTRPVPAQANPTPTASSPTRSSTVAGAGTPPAATDSLAPSDATTNAPVVVADPTPPTPITPKLQGIFYRPERPSAVINGKYVYIGSRVAEFQVLAFTQENVIIGNATQTNVLSMVD